MGDYEKAIAHYTAAISIAPEKALFHRNRGYAYQQLEQWEPALQDYTEALRLAPENRNYYVQRADINYRAGHKENALADYRKATQPSSHYAIHINFGDLLLEMNQKEEALAQYLKAVEMAPDEHVTHSRCGVWYFKQNRFGEAQTAFDEAIKLNESEFNYYADRGNARLQLGEFENAKEDLTRAIELHPTGVEYNLLGIANFRLGEYRRALANFTNTLFQDHFPGNVFGNWLDAYQHLNASPEEAAIYFILYYVLCTPPSEEEALKVILTNFPFLQETALAEAADPLTIASLLAKPIAAAFSSRMEEFREALYPVIIEVNRDHPQAKEVTLEFATGELALEISMSISSTLTDNGAGLATNILQGLQNGFFNDLSAMPEMQHAEFFAEAHSLEAIEDFKMNFLGKGHHQYFRYLVFVLRCKLKGAKTTISTE
jgi:tetratricopeptide (TPR) repeat protein